MELLATREKAVQLLDGDLKAEATAVAEAFALCNRLIAEFEGNSIGDMYLTYCGLTTLKGQRLALGCYALMMDGLGQEAGALLRPLIETVELLTYFRLDPARVEEALEDNLPGAGAIAKAIEGGNQDLRRYLNTHASHISYDWPGFGHLIETNTSTWHIGLGISPEVLRTNMATLFAFVHTLCIEAARCLQLSNKLDDYLGHTVDNMRMRGLKVFADPKD